MNHLSSSNATASSDALIQELAAGSDAAWTRLVDQHGRLVMLACRRTRLTSAESDDVFQTTFLSAFKAIGSLRNADALPAWLYQIAHRAALSHIRKRRPDLSIDDPDGATFEADLSTPPSQLDLLTAFEDAAQVRGALSQLNDRDRDLLSALYLETPRPSYDAISSRLAIPIGSIGPTRSRALNKLRKVYEDVSIDPPSSSSGVSDR